MRYLVGFVMLSLVASPLNAAAQSSDETSPHAAAPFSLEYDPALQPYEEARDRVLQSRNGIIGSSVVMALGAALVGGGAALQRNEVKQEGSLDTGVVRSLNWRSHDYCGHRRDDRIGSQVVQT
jgi:hypothetical protein